MAYIRKILDAKAKEVREVQMFPVINGDGRIVGLLDLDGADWQSHDPGSGLTMGEPDHDNINIGNVWNGASYDTPEPDLTAEITAAKIEEAWGEQQRRFAESYVTVSVNGSDRNYGCDPATRENITAIVNAISAAPAMVPDPRPFTPKGEAAPVNTTHVQFIEIYLAGLAKGDAFYAAYAAHKVAIMGLATVAEVDSYDLSQGWPA